MPDAELETAGDAGNSSAAEVDVAALFEQLKDEVRRLGPRLPHLSGADAARMNARAMAERLWPVSADRHIGGRGGAVGAFQRPVKLVLRKLMRWSVEPAFADQRAYNDATLKLIDDIYERLDRVEALLRARENGSS